MSPDPYSDPQSGVLRNLLGITDPIALQRAEDGITAAAIADLELRRLPGGYDLKHLALFHREVFEDLYPWAGEIRTVSIAKTDPFCAPQFIEAYADEVFHGLAQEAHLREYDRVVFLERLTHYFGEINAIHPFREGNGRTQRAFFGQLARDAGRRLNWALIDPEENNIASRASLRGDSSRLHRLLDRLLSRD